MLSLASQHGAEILHGPGEGDVELFSGFWAGDVPRVPGLDEHLIFCYYYFLKFFLNIFFQYLAVVVTFWQGEKVGNCLLAPK